MSGPIDISNNIGNLEKINTLWKQYNNLINTKPTGYIANEEVPFKNYVINNNIFNEDIPENILIINDTSLNVMLPNNQTIEFIITANDFSSNSNYLNINILDSLFDQSDNILVGSKCNFENLGYKHIEFYYKKECYPTIHNTTDQIYTWFIPEPSNCDIRTSGTKNLLKNTIPFLYDPYKNTYKYNLFYKLNFEFIKIDFVSWPDFAYLDYKSGFLYFYGGIRDNNIVTLANIRTQNDSNPSPPYMSYIRYNGNVGFNNLNLKGNIRIDNSLSIINDNLYNDISNIDYNVLNTQQIRQYINSLNISGGGGSGGGGGLTLNQILNANNDASFNNLYIGNSFTISGDTFATQNYVNTYIDISLNALNFDSSYALLTDFNDLSGKHYSLKQIVQTICGADFAGDIVDLSANIIFLQSTILNISGQVNNVQNSINELDVSYVTDLAFDASYNQLSSKFSILESSFVNLDLSLNALNFDSSYALLTDFNDLSGKHYNLKQTVQTICGQINNLQNSINTLDTSYVTDLAFDMSYNVLSANFSILETSFINLDLSNTLYGIDTSLTNLQNNIEIGENISNKHTFDIVELLNQNSIVNIINSGGNKYVFNNLNTYDVSKNYGLRAGNYVLKDIPHAHPIALLNKDISNLITYIVDDNSPIIINVSGGQSLSPYYTFKDADDNNIDINTFKFMRNRSYQFNADGISSSHPFQIFVNNAFTNAIDCGCGNIRFTINNNHSLVDGDFYYQSATPNSAMKKNLYFLNDGTYDFYYGDVSINVLGDFGILSIYCFCDDYMGGQNLLQYVSNYYTTTTDVIQDLSSLFFNTITPNKNSSNILININANLYSSYALEERITVELWRDLSMLTKSNNLGSVIATGGLTIPYNFTYIDSPNTNTLLKYYLKYQLENNNSSQEMGIINIQNDLNYGHSNIILREL